MIRPILFILDAIMEIDQDAAYKFCNTFRRQLRTDPGRLTLKPDVAYYFGNQKYFVKFVDDAVLLYKERDYDKGIYDLLGEVDI